MKGFDDVGKVYSPGTLREALSKVDLSWAKGVTVHHTAVPDLSMRPNGFSTKLIENMAWYYQHEKGWSAGPHLFVDENSAWGMTPLSMPGVHARSFNKTHVGIELLGDFDNASEVESARGRAVIWTAVRIVAELCASQGWDPASVNMHRDDPKTAKTCPGALFPWKQFIEDVGKRLAEQKPAKDARQDEISKRLESIEWQIKQLKRLI